MQKLTWKTETRKLSELEHWDANPRTCQPKALAKLKDRIAKRGFHDVLKLDGDTVISGNQRLDALRELGYSEATVLVPSRKLTKAEMETVALESNRNDGENDIDKLFALDGVVLKEAGFSQTELDLLMGAKQPTDEDGYDPTDELKAPSKAKIGDLYALGEHLLLCGDSTDPKAYKRLMGGDKASMCFTDPPFGVSYVGKTKDALEIENDRFDEEGTRLLWSSAYVQFREALKDGGAIYVTVPPGPLNLMFAQVMKDYGDLRQMMVWAKNQFVLGHGDYHYRHEPILYGWKSTGAHTFYGGRDKDTVWEELSAVKTSKDGEFTVIKFQGFEVFVKGVVEYGYVRRRAQKIDVWRYDRPSRSAEHPTMKPVELIEEAIKNSSRTDDIVLDPFGGSGTTIIACENLGRKARLIELDPKYVDVICDRFEKLTGIKPVKLAS